MSSEHRSRLVLTLDLEAGGRRVGDLKLRWSDNANPLGHRLIPVISIKGGAGPTALFLGGTHGDEFEGPAALLRLAERLRPEELAGQVILIPALNLPALAASSRVSPLDGGNLNRAFPGDSGGGPTAMLAHYLESELIPRVDAVVDLHSGGKASVFAPSTLATVTEDAALFARNLALAEAFGLPTIWRLGAFNDNRSVNSAAARCGMPMIATELGGGGGVDPALVEAAEDGLRRVLASLGMLGEAPPLPAGANLRQVEIVTGDQAICAPARGLYDRLVSAGEQVAEGQCLGWLRFVEEPARDAIAIAAHRDGFVLAHGNRGLVDRGELLVQLVDEVTAS